jgi:DNA (cytosine-5)-methyltransferase 1
MAKYTVIKKKAGLEGLKYFEEEHAFFTHYLQSPEIFQLSNYDQKLLDFIDAEELNKVEEFNYYLPLKFDVPFPPPKNPKYTFIDLFAGIGGMRIAHQNAGGKCVFSSEWDKFAKITYEANFGEVPFGDITKINEKFIPNHDVLVAGFPCQPFSIAGVSKKNSLGKKHGFLDETQGTLFFDIARIIKEKRPKAFMLENVKNLKSHDKGKTFKVIKSTLEKLNYTVYAEVLDGKYFVPQHRERILIIGFDKKRFKGKEDFKFPEMPDLKKNFGDILESNPDPKYTLTNKLWNYLQDYAKKHKEKGNGFGFGLTDLEGISRTISARYYKDGSEVLIPQNGTGNPRRLTPRECARLQGYPDKFNIPVSDNQAYRQFGNSVVVPLMEKVAIQIGSILTPK